MTRPRKQHQINLKKADQKRNRERRFLLSRRCKKWSNGAATGRKEQNEEFRAAHISKTAHAPPPTLTKEQSRP